jgi:hypothetical protein
MLVDRFSPMNLITLSGIRVEERDLPLASRAIGVGPSAQPFSGSTSTAFIRWLNHSAPLPWCVVVFGDESDGLLHNHLYTH